MAKVKDKKVQHKKKKKAIYPPLRLLSIAPKSTAIAPFYNSKIKVFAEKKDKRGQKNSIETS